MARRKYKITWEPKSKRWVKKHHGRQYWIPGSEYPTEEAAWLRWLQIKAEADLKIQTEKPHRTEYEKAIQTRQQAAQWCREHGEDTQAKVFQSEADALMERFNRLADPPALTPEEEEPFSSLFRQRIMASDGLKRMLNPDGSIPTHLLYRGFSAKINEVWRDRLKQYGKKIEPHQAISEHIESYLRAKKTRANGREISMGYWSVLSAHLHRLQKWIGASFPIKEINAKTMADYYTHLLELCQAETISRKYASDNLTTVRQFVRNCWELELCGLPRNIDSREMRFDVGSPKIVVFSPAELKAIYDTGREKTKLYVLLGLNTGMTQADIAALRHGEVDWTAGTITRKRTKTRKKKNVPTVTYTLWPNTFALLKKYRSDHAELVLLNKDGLPLRRERLGEGYRKNDAVAKAMQKVMKRCKIAGKGFKHLRKTGASLLNEPAEHRHFTQLYLGHAPVSVADRNYADYSQAAFDRAITWLGKEVKKILASE